MSDLIKELRKEIKSKLDIEVGTVITFKSRSTGSGYERHYDYAAIFAGDHKWYLTGKNGYYGNQLTTAEFLKVLKLQDVHSIKIATDWAEL